MIRDLFCDDRRVPKLHPSLSNNFSVAPAVQPHDVHFLEVVAAAIRHPASWWILMCEPDVSTVTADVRVFHGISLSLAENIVHD